MGERTKSWREIDRSKEKSTNRRDVGQRAPSPSAHRQKSYRAALDRLFESGKIGALAEQRDSAADASVNDSKRQKQRLDRIDEAVSPDELRKAVESYLGEYPLPTDADILEKMVQVRDTSIQMQVLEKLSGMTDQLKPRHKRSLKARLDLICDTADDVDIIELAKDLQRSLA